MSKYRKYYCPRRRELFVEIDRIQPGTAGGNVSQEDWDAIKWDSPTLKELAEKEEAEVEEVEEKEEEKEE